MRNKELRKFKRDGKSAIAATLAGLVLAGIGLWTVAKNRQAPLEDSACLTILVMWAMLLSPVIGILGASVYSLNRASLVGAFIVGLPATIPAFLFPRGVGHQVWFLAACFSFGSILGQVGALAGGALAEREVSPQRKQFSLSQMLAFFIPVAIFLGFVTQFPKR